MTIKQCSQVWHGILIFAGGSEAVDTAIRVWYSLCISQSDFSLLKSALEELLAAGDLSTLTNDCLNVATPDQLRELKRVWQTWVELSSGHRGRWVTKRRNAAFQRDSQSKEGIENYLKSIPEHHRESAKLWMENGLFASKCKASCLTIENVTLTGSPFQRSEFESDYDFCIQPSTLPFSGWDYKAIKDVCYNDSLPEMYCSYLTNIMNMCITKLRSQVKLYVIRCDCMAMEQFLSMELKYDRITTSNLSDYISLTILLTVNTNNSHSVLVTEVQNWEDNYFPEVQDQIRQNYFELTNKVVKDTNNPSLVFTNLTSFVEYHDHIPDFQLYVRAALIESRDDQELASLANKKKLPSIKTITATLGLQLRDFVRNENKIFPFKRAINCRRVNLLRGDEFCLEWTLSSSAPQ